MKKSVFAGTFDPLTLGHEKIIEKCSKLFDSVVVALCVNASKTARFSVETRLEIIKTACKKYNNVEVVYHEGYLVDLMKERGIIYTVRGIRNDADYAYETNMHQVNKGLYSEVETIFMPCDSELDYVSSTAVRKAIESGEDLTKYLSSEVIKVINKTKA